MQPDEAKVGKKYIITYNDGGKVRKVTAKILHNDIAEKFMRLETKEYLYECPYKYISFIQSFNLFLWKIIGILCIVIFWAVLLFLLGKELYTNIYTKAKLLDAGVEVECDEDCDDEAADYYSETANSNQGSD